jgi:hypothetical protein
MGTVKLKSSDEVFQLKISLLGSDPEIWRTIQISSAATLSRPIRQFNLLLIGKIAIYMNSRLLSMKRSIKDKN